MKRLFAALVLLPSLLLPATAFAAATSTATSTPTSASPKVVQPPTCALFAAGNSVKVGNTVNLSWTSSNATEGTISTIGSVGPSGTQGVIPLPPSTTYVGQFAGPGGNATCSITIGVGASGYYTFDTGMPDYAAPGTSAPGPLTIPTNAPQSFTQSGGTVGGGGIVQCTGAADCNLCTFGKTFQKLLNFLVGLTIPLAAIAFAFAGWLYFSNADNPGQVERGKKIFKSVLIGFIVVLMAWLMIQTILKTVAPGYQSWNNWDCSNLNRPMNSNLGQTIDNALGRPQAAPSAQGTAPPVNAYNYNGTQQSTVVCPAGATYNAGAFICESCTGSGADKTCEEVAPVSDTQLVNNGCPAGATLTGGECQVCYGGGINEDGSTIAPDYCETVAPSPQLSNTDCSAGNIQAAAAAGGYQLTDTQAATLSCIAVPESTCGADTRIATTPSGQVTSAAGMFQIVFGSGNDQCHNLNLDVCTQAAQAAGYQVDGNLNCYDTVIRQGQKLGSPACRAAAANIQCNASAAACLVQARNGRFTDWTSDSRSSTQAQCIQRYNG